jgi:PhoPQ-activated pathogenicity-related protein
MGLSGSRAGVLGGPGPFPEPDGGNPAMSFHPRLRGPAWLPVWAGLVAGLAAPAARADLQAYVNRPEPAFAWQFKGKTESAQGTIYDLSLVSQTWQGVTWQHQLQVYQPKGVAPNATLFLWNTGGPANPLNAAFGMELARKIKAPVAFLYHIPNQPLLDGRKEDALIAETFVRYLKTQDESWPLLFPMVKSLVKAMDALQAFGKQEWQQPVQKFIVSGGSKRGWTTWLTAAADPRVKAIAPAVIDTLNMRAQMPHQLETLGQYSEMIHDYTEAGLLPMPNTPEARRLWGMVDPWVYRTKLTLPKCILNGANDPYWATDALNLYWDDLTGDKWVIYVPNAGHDLVERRADGGTDRNRALDGLAAFARHQIADKPLPRLRWKHEAVDGKLRLSVASDPPAAGARLWVAQAPTQDFRKARWNEQAVTTDGKGTVMGLVAPPAEGWLAFFGELDYETEGIKYHLCTQMRVAGQGKK